MVLVVGLLSKSMMDGSLNGWSETLFMKLTGDGEKSREKSRIARKVSPAAER